MWHCPSYDKLHQRSISEEKTITHLKIPHQLRERGYWTWLYLCDYIIGCWLALPPFLSRDIYTKYTKRNENYVGQIIYIRCTFKEERHPFSCTVILCSVNLLQLNDNVWDEFNFEIYFLVLETDKSKYAPNEFMTLS